MRYSPSRVPRYRGKRQGKDGDHEPAGCGRSGSNGFAVRSFRRAHGRAACRVGSPVRHPGDDRLGELRRSGGLEAVGSAVTNTYAGGCPDERCYGGCDRVDVGERLAIDRAKGSSRRDVKILLTLLWDSPLGLPQEDEIRSGCGHRRQKHHGRSARWYRCVRRKDRTPVHGRAAARRQTRLLLSGWR